jgi:hypothetical protein
MMHGQKNTKVFDSEGSGADTFFGSRGQVTAMAAPTRHYEIYKIPIIYSYGFFYPVI